MTFFAEGEIETMDAAGVVSGQIEKFPLDVFLRDVEATHADKKMLQFVADSLAGEADPLGRMHVLMGALQTSLRLRARRDAGAASGGRSFQSRQRIGA